MKALKWINRKKRNCPILNYTQEKVPNKTFLSFNKLQSKLEKFEANGDQTETDNDRELG